MKMNDNNNSTALTVYVQQNAFKKRLSGFKTDLSVAISSVYTKRKKQLLVFLALHLLFTFFGSSFCVSDLNTGAVVYNLISGSEYRYAVSFFSIVLALSGVSMLGKPISCAALLLESFLSGIFLSYSLKNIVNDDRFYALLLIVLVSVFSFVFIVFCSDVFVFYSSESFFRSGRSLSKRILLYSLRSFVFMIIFQIVLFLLFKI